MTTVLFVVPILYSPRWIRVRIWSYSQLCLPSAALRSPEQLTYTPSLAHTGLAEALLWQKNTVAFQQTWMRCSQVVEKWLCSCTRISWDQIFQDCENWKERKMFDCSWESYFPSFRCLCFMKLYHCRLGISAYNLWRRSLVIIYQSFKWTWNQGDKMNNSL